MYDVGTMPEMSSWWSKLPGMICDDPLISSMFIAERSSALVRLISDGDGSTAALGRLLERSPEPSPGRNKDARCSILSRPDSG